VKSSSALLLAAALALGVASCQKQAPQAQYSQKVVILGFDGMDPELTEQWMAAGRLPNLSRLAAQGGFYRLETSHSPESPTSWASFATGSNAGKHNIFDFLVRNPKTYMPDLGIVQKVQPEFLFNYLPIKKPEIKSIRGGTSFWVTAGQHGVRSSVLTVPVTFPPATTTVVMSDRFGKTMSEQRATRIQGQGRRT